MPAPSTSKTTNLILRQIEEGDFYAAHLKARSTAARLLKGTEYDDKAKEAAGMLFTSAQALLQKGQAGSGTDLALYLIDTWSTRGVVCSDEERAQLTQLIALCGRSESWRSSIIHDAVVWTGKTGESPAGDEQLHLYIGELLAKEKDYLPAESHLLAAPNRDAAHALAQLLYDWSLIDGHKAMGAGRYAARGVFSYLENGSLFAARTFLEHFLHLFLSSNPSFSYDQSSVALPSKYVNEEQHFIVTTLPGLNFIQLVILTVQAGAGTLRNPPSSGNSGKGAGRTAWNALWQKYEKDIPWLKAGTVKASKAKLDEMYFGVKKPQQGNDMLSNLMGLFGGGGGAPAGGTNQSQRRVATPALD